jgi:hypothetical protein
MARGGARDGAGRPKFWLHPMEPRKCLTIPIDIAELTMQAAKLLDAGDEELLELLQRKAKT